MKRRIFILAVTALVAASKYHMREMKRAHDSGFEAGWDGGRRFERGEFGEVDPETGDLKESK